MARKRKQAGELGKGSGKQMVERENQEIVKDTPFNLALRNIGPTYEEVAEKLGVGRKTLWRWITKPQYKGLMPDHVPWPVKDRIVELSGVSIEVLTGTKKQREKK